jgi:anti-sigma factor RsiW
MNHQPSHPDLEALLGAYAIDAVDSDERRLVERHLPGCAACRAEVAAHQEVAGLLIADGPAPDEIWADIVTSLEETPPPLELAPVIPLSSQRTRTTTVMAAVTAVAAAAVAILGVRVVNQDHRLNRLQAAMSHDDVQQAALTALANPTATTVALRAPTGGAAARVALLPDGRGYVLADGLAPLSPARTYQLWALIAGQRISAGTLGPQPKVAAFHVSGEVGGFAITEEQAPGAVASKNPPVLIGWVRPA